MQKSRLSTGGALVVVLISALVLVILGVGFIFFSKIFGGGREMQNAVDSGSLNAAKTALIRPGYNAQAGDDDEAQFLGFENQGQNPDFSLGNINRVWGQALLVSLNYKAMVAEQSHGDKANENAQKTVAAAKRINDKVAEALRPVSSLPAADLKTAFLNTSNSNTLKMVSSNANDQLEISNGAQVGFQDAKGQANIAIPDTMMANIVDSEDLATLQTTLAKISAGSTAFSGQAISRADGSKFNANGRLLNGYQDLSIDEDKKIYFVPLRPEAKPHMLSGTEFNSAKPQLTATENPVSNSFFTKGKMKEDKSNQMLDFAAIALAEPVDPAFAMSIPRGFIKVKNWKGFRTDGTMLNAHTNNPNLASNQGNNRGMHAAEYANHQLLMARSGYEGPNHAQNDPFATEMGNPYFGLTRDQNPVMVGSGDEAHPVYGRESQVQELININDAIAAGQDPPAAPPLDSDRQCGGRFVTDLPDDIKCSDIKTNPNGFAVSPAEVSVSVNGDGQVVATNPGQQDALSTAIVAHIVENVHENELPWGSDIHPHIWSVDPQQVNALNGSVTDFMKTGPANDPYAWMYTGQLILDDKKGLSHMSRDGVATQSPIAFGRAGSIWEYLEDKEPGQGTANVQEKVLNRLTQRVMEIKPDFANGQDARSAMETLLKSANLDMNQDAYIFMENNEMKIGVVQGGRTDHVSGAQLPDWLKSEIGALARHGVADGDGLADGKHPELLGKTVFYGPRRSITTQPDPLSPKVENVPGDWGYPVPYTNADNPPPGAQMVEIQLSNKFVFRPCTGYQGQLAVLELKSFIHNPGCPPVDYSTSPATFPEECPCTNFPVGSVPEPTPSDPNMPNGWTRGVGVQTDTVLPNCSHTGAC